MRTGSVNFKKRRLLAQGYSALNENQTKRFPNPLDYLASREHLDLILKSIIVDPKYLGKLSLK